MVSEYRLELAMRTDSLSLQSQLLVAVVIESV